MLERRMDRPGQPQGEVIYFAGSQGRSIAIQLSAINPTYGAVQKHLELNSDIYGRDRDV